MLIFASEKLKPLCPYWERSIIDIVNFIWNMYLGWEPVPGCWRLDKPPALLSSWTDCKAGEMYPGDQWAAKQMTWIRTRVPMNFPWTREGRWSMAVSPFLSLLQLLSLLPHPAPLYIHFPSSLPSPRGPKAVVVLKLKSLTSLCHSAVPLRRFAIMWDFWFERQQFIFQCVDFHSHHPLVSLSLSPIVSDQAWFIHSSLAVSNNRPH